MSPFADRLLLVLLGLATVLAVQEGSAQPSSEGSSEVRRARVDLRASDWKARTKAGAGVRVDETIRLRPETRVGHALSNPIALPFSVNGVGSHWAATVPEGTGLEVEIRTRSNGRGWGGWIPVADEATVGRGASDGRKESVYTGDHSGGLIVTEAETRFVQVRVTLHRKTKATPRLRRLSLYLVDATAGPRMPSIRPEGEAAAVRPDTSEPRIYARTEWGAQPATADYRYAPASHLAIHHTATASAGAADTWEECAAAVRAIQDYHINGRGWIDIGYNYLICQTGAVFQGREDGNDGRDVVAAHDGYNEGSVGTSGIGYFHPPEDQQPTQALLDGFVDLFAWIAVRREIDPTGVSPYAGYGQSLRTVYGHRDVKATACPGDHLYARRSALVDRLDSLVPTLPTRTTLSPNAPNPAGSITRFDLALSTRRSVRLTVFDLLGRRVVTRRYGILPAGEHTVSVRTKTWAPGTYPYRLRVGEKMRSGTIRVVR